MRSILELAEPDLWALQVDENGDRSSGVFCCLSHVGVNLFVHRVGAVAEVHACDVDTRLDDGSQVVIARCCRAECCDDFRASHVFLLVVVGGGSESRSDVAGEAEQNVRSRVLDLLA